MDVRMRQQRSAAEYYLLDYEKYEDYLDTFVGTHDLRFVRDIRFCRELAQLGYHRAEVYTPEKFEAQKKILLEESGPAKRETMFSASLNSKEPLLIELAAREQLNNQKTISTIIFLTHRTKHGFGVSAFIDFGASLKHCTLQLPGFTDWRAVFKEKIKLCPKKGDLSYYDEHKFIVRHTDSENYLVRHDVKLGLNFMHRGDHKTIFVDNKEKQTERSYLRSEVMSPKYGFVVLYDHIVHKMM